MGLQRFIYKIDQKIISEDLLVHSFYIHLPLLAELILCEYYCIFPCECCRHNGLLSYTVCLHYRPALDSFDFPKEFLDNLHSYPLDRVNSLEYDQTKSEDSKVKPDTSISSNDNCTNTAVQSELTEATNVGTNSANKTKSENTTVDTNSAIKTESMDATNSAIKTESVEATNVDTKTAEEMETLESTVSGDTNSKCGAGDCVLDSVPCQQSVTVTEDTQGDTDNKAQVCTSLRKSTENVATQGDTEASRKSTENGDTQGDRENHVQGSTSSEEPTARTADAECGTEDMDTGPRETPGGSGQTELGQDGANSDDKAKRKRVCLFVCKIL